MDKNQYINTALNEFAHLQKMEPNPYMFEKVLQKIESRYTKLSAPQKFAWAFATSLILVLNVWGAYSYIKSNEKLKENSAYEMMVNEMQSHTTYYY